MVPSAIYSVNLQTLLLCALASCSYIFFPASLLSTRLVSYNTTGRFRPSLNTHLCTCISLFLHIWHVERREDEQVLLLLLLQNTYFRTLPRCVKTLDDFLRSEPLHPYPLGSSFLAFLHPLDPPVTLSICLLFPSTLLRLPLTVF